jgi:hypothetical protein
MEDSNMLQLSLSSGRSSFSFNHDFNDNDNDDTNDDCRSSSFGLFDHGVWSRFQESFSADQELQDYDDDDDDDDDDDCYHWCTRSSHHKEQHQQRQQQQQQEKQKKVHFSTVVVHEHALIVGDNPSVREGVPLSMEWKAQSTITYETVDAHENERRQRQQQKRNDNDSDITKNKNNKDARRLDSEERMFRLLNSGVSLRDIQQSEARTNADRGLREATKQQHLLWQGGLHTKTTKLFWKALQRRGEDSSDEER